MLLELFFIFLILLAGSFIQGVSGFGFGLLAMSFLPLLFTVKDSTLLVVSLALIVSTSIAVQLYKHIKWRALLVMLAAAFVGRIGAFFILSNYGELPIMRDFLGAFLILVVIYLFFGKGLTRYVPRVTAPLAITLGALGGFVGGIYAVGGPFFVFLLMLMFKDDKYAYSANLQVTFVFTNTITVLLHALNGDFTSSWLLYFAVGVVTVLIGTRLGVACFTYVSQENTKRIAGVIVAIAAINFLL
ncbi:sulfite exporter TauE/SafE family protein [Paenalkalicoccus suaedae]|uniref:Probable membrane transporter protein n=1 Tax=Paenalkalicoccus suaedae TaxID=2592382 RepID=A0A859FI97_9BACI|nr:sulfite exporter TauE/SafE family protein [Paenalkalicoccus suaedae]QKS72424.1 sulfite exporter TauE/SafE family protein [Paenalkalicoccus suaedae]